MECDAFIMAALLPGNLRQTFIVPNSDRSRSLAQAGKEARKEGGGGQVNRKGSRGRRVRVRTKRWYSYFPSDKANNRFLGNPSALAHCSSSLRAATKGGNAGRGGKRE